MAFQRTMDGKSGRFGRTIGQFLGWHSGYSKPDEPNAHSRTSDFDCSEKEMSLRDGCKKNQGWGYPADITDMISLNIGGRALMGQISNGVLTIYPTADILAGNRTYYTVSEVTGEFTVSSLTAKTVNDLIKGNR